MGQGPDQPVGQGRVPSRELRGERLQRDVVLPGVGSVPQRLAPVPFGGPRREGPNVFQLRGRQMSTCGCSCG